MPEEIPQNVVIPGKISLRYHILRFAIILGFVFGIVGLSIESFNNGYSALKLIYVLITSISFISFIIIYYLNVYQYYFSHISPLNAPCKIIESRINLRLTEGGDGFYKKRQKIIALTDGFEGFTSRDLKAIPDPNKGPQPELIEIQWCNHRITNVILPNGHMETTFLFKDGPLNKKMITILEWSAIFHRTFPTDEEFFSVRFTFPCDFFEIIIEFPAAKSYKNVWLSYTDSESPIEYIINHDNIIKRLDDRRIRVQLKRPRLRSYYTIRWRW